MEFPLTVNSQEDFDRLIAGRLERARQKWASESGVADAQEQAREAEARARAAEAKATERLARRDARAMLAEMGVTERARQERILRLADFDNLGVNEAGEPSEKDLRDAIKAVHKDLPEVFGEGVQVVDVPADAGERSGSGADVPITSEDQLTKLSPEQINSSWDRVAAFLRGER